MYNLLESQEFKRLEQIYPFLGRAREHIFGLEKEKYVVLDIETTGLDYTKSEIIEIAGLKIENGQPKDILNTLIKPKAIITPEIERLTGISQDMVFDYPSILDIAPKFLSFLENHLLVVHNSDFDISFLKHHLPKVFENRTICTLKISRLLLPNLQNHKLPTVASYFGVQAQNSHRALGDAETTFQVWMEMIPLLRDKGIYTKDDLQKLGT